MEQAILRTINNGNEADQKTIAGFLNRYRMALTMVLAESGILTDAETLCITERLQQEEQV